MALVEDDQVSCCHYRVAATNSYVLSFVHFNDANQLEIKETVV